VLSVTLSPFFLHRKEDWNEIQRTNSQKSDPIGSRRSIKAKSDRGSLRRKILEINAAGEIVKNDVLLGIAFQLN
jgi:hypothetical protein